MRRPTNRTRPRDGESWWPPRLEGCRNCGTVRDLTTYAARDIDATDNAPTFNLRLCGRCVRDRGGAWRWRWKIAGRDLPGHDERAA